MLVTCFSLTVLFDMTVSVTMGVMIASLLFMRRMAEVSSVNLLSSDHPALPKDLPGGVVVYEVTGALFFGAAQKAMSSLDNIAGQGRAVVLDVTAVPAMDATGLVNLSSSLDRLSRDGTYVILAGVQARPAKVMAKAGIEATDGDLAFCATVHDALAEARRWAAERDAAGPPRGGGAGKPGPAG